MLHRGEVYFQRSRVVFGLPFAKCICLSPFATGAVLFLGGVFSVLFATTCIVKINTSMI